MTLAPHTSRRRLDVVHTPHHPRYVVWELTLRCDHACTHCGSRAGVARDGELSTEEALEVVEQLAAMGTREVVLIGGEAYLHEGFFEITRALAARGVAPVMTTGGRAIDLALARRLREAGLQRCSVSLDGLAPAHDLMRARKGSFDDGMRAIAALREAGIVPQANTTLNRLNEKDLEGLYEALRDAGVAAWQVQLMAPLGRAADRPDLLLQPYELLELFPRITEVKRRGLAEGLLLMPGNNLGFFGPEEALLRSPTEGGHDHFQGCQAGRFVLGIESNGAVKGCPSLQSAAYVGGTLREQSLDAIWNGTEQLAFARARTRDDLWGFCRECPYADVCLAGCSFTAHSFFGRPGNNPYCHYRALEHRRRGLRERLVATDPASGKPFDHGLFELVVEPLDALLPVVDRRPSHLVAIGRKPTRRVD